MAAYLSTLDLNEFDAKAPPPKTTAWWAIVDANCAPENAELADILEIIDKPAVTLQMIKDNATGDFLSWLTEPKNRRAIPHRLEQCGYVQVRYDDAQDGLWKVSGKRQVIYARSVLPLRERIDAAKALQEHGYESEWRRRHYP